jgi:HK97 family phage prohead protease
MPYFIWDESPSCSGWAVVKADGSEVACHTNKQEAIENMVALSIIEGIEPGGSYDDDQDEVEQAEIRDLPDNYRPALADDVPEGRACGNCLFFDESRVNDAGDKAWCQRWDEFVDGGYYCNAWAEDEDSDDDESRSVCEDCDGNCEVCKETREVNLTPPAYMRAAARQGLRYYEQGLAGDGLVERTVREARAMAAGNVTADKWVRIAAWIARHLVDLDAPAARPNSPDYPSAGVVAHLLWGSGPSKSAANRALEYAKGVVSRIEQENEGRAKGEALSKIETRVFTNEFEVREDAAGMRLTGYAARFNEPSEPLPFIERIAPGAFKRSLKSRNDIKLLWNHDSSMVLGSTRAGTLKLMEDERGLYVDAILPDTTYGRDAKVSIQRGDVTGFSFGFTVPAGGDSWNSDGNERTLKSVRLLEVSTGVAFPAYPSTNGTAQVRGLDKVAKRAGIDADALADALLKIEDGQEITGEEKDMLSRVISDLAPTEPAEVKPDLSILMLKKKKLDLLAKGII